MRPDFKVTVASPRSKDDDDGGAELLVCKV